MFGTKVVLTIEGMACIRCSGRVEAALNALEGVKAKVDLDKKTATVKECDDRELLVRTVTDLGFTVVDVK